MNDGGRLAGRFENPAAGVFVFRAARKTHDLGGIQRIWFPARSNAHNNRRPARVFHLRGGGRVTGELIAFDQNTITLKLRGKTVELPQRSIVAIDRCRGERPIVFEDFQSGTLPGHWTKTGTPQLSRRGGEAWINLSPNDGLLVSLNPAIRAGRVSLAFFDSGNDSALAGGVEFSFQREYKPADLTVALDSKDPFYAVSSSVGFPITRQPVRRAAGWQMLTLLFDETRFQILVGGKLLAFARPQEASLKSLKFFAGRYANGESRTADDSVLVIDDLQISARDPQEPDLPPVSIDQQGTVLLNGGDLVYGTIQAVDSAKIEIEGLFGKIAIPWNRARRIVFGGKTEAAFRPQIKTGVLADLRLTRFADHPDQPGDRLTGVVESLSDKHLRLHHPRLGKLELASGEMVWIEPRFVGDVLPLTLEVRHLGNKHRPDFRNKQHQDHAWNGEFTLKEPDNGPAFLELSVSDLEPAGKDTPLGSPTFMELRGGFLGTAVFLNGKPLGRLNDHIFRISSPDDPQTIRLPIPEGLLKTGENTWRIEQRPKEKHASEFDDCEIGPIRLLIGKTRVAAGASLSDD